MFFICLGSQVHRDLQSKPTPAQPPPVIASTSTPQPEVAAPATAPAPAAPQVISPVPAAPAPVAPPTPSAAPAAAPVTADGSFLTGEALQSTINNMVEMGFEREQVIRALRASFNNPDRAVEYLMTVFQCYSFYLSDTNLSHREFLRISCMKQQDLLHDQHRRGV